jgi:hypothetical protein
VNPRIIRFRRGHSHVATLMRGSLSLVAVLAAISRAPAVEVRSARLDGSTADGELRTWSATQVTIDTPQGDQTVAVNQLLSVRFQDGPATPPVDTASLPFVEFVDGTRLPISDYRTTGTRAVVSVPPMAQAVQKEIAVAVRQVAAVRLHPLSPTTMAQWDEVRAQNLPSDVLMVLKRGGESLDYVEGVAGNISSDKVDFKLDEETTRADRKLVAGVSYFRGDARTGGDPRCIVYGKSGLKAVLAEASLNGEALQMKTVNGVEFAWPLVDITLADFSAGKIAYLSDLEPAVQKWTPLVAIPATASAAASYGKMRRDRSPFGGPLTLLSQDNSLTRGGRERSFDKGLALRSRTELTYRLPAGYRRFTALAGIDPKAAASGNVKLTIQADERGLFTRDIAGGEPPVPLDVDISNARRLSITVDYGRNLDSGDWLILGDARIVK